MIETMPLFSAAIPEIVTAVMLCVALLAHLFLHERLPSIAFTIVLLTLVFNLGWLVHHFNEPRVITFHGLFVADKLAKLLKLFICLISFFVLLYSREYIRNHGMAEGEYYVLALSAVLGMLVLVSAANFITLFMGLELFSLPVYAMVAFKRDSTVTTEAAMKYFIVGALGSGMLLYGLSMLYGATGSLQIAETAKAVAQTQGPQSLILVFALVFITAGVAFKLGAVPFHMWIPDVYDGAPTSVTLFVSTAPKLAALAMAFRLWVEAMPQLAPQWQPMLIVLSIASMALGNFVAIAQSNIKRMLAYSSIAHVGYTLLGLLAVSHNGYASALFYMITYAIMTAGAFGLIAIMSRDGSEIEQIDDLRGLSHRNPWLAFLMLLLMFSMAGIPPIVGFMAKVAVLEALISAGFVWLAALALLFAIIGSYYYIRVVKVMYFEKPDVYAPMALPADLRVAVSINALSVLYLGIFPGGLFHICQYVAP